jgi:hypothetical protein
MVVDCLSINIADTPQEYDTYHTPLNDPILEQILVQSLPLGRLAWRFRQYAALPTLFKRRPLQGGGLVQPASREMLCKFRQRDQEGGG